MLDLALLGCGGSMPIPSRYLTSLLIRYQGKMILIDCGEGTQVSMKLLGWGFKSIDIICITHMHGDHIYGLPGLLSTIRNYERYEPITIIGPKGIKKIIDSILMITPFLSYEINVVENPFEYKFMDNMIIKTIDLKHSIPCIGFSFNINRNRKFIVNKAIENNVPRIIWSKLQKDQEVIYDGKTYQPKLVLGDERKGLKFSYITDTRPVNKLIEFIKNSDLFIAEGMYGDDNDSKKAISNKHMTFKEAATLALNANVDEMILTHFSPSMKNPDEFLDNARNIFPNSIIGFDRLIKSLKFENV